MHEALQRLGGPGEALSALCLLCGVEPVYHDGLGTRREAPVESILQTLRALGAPVAAPEDAPRVLRQLQDERRRRVRPAPVLVATPGGEAEFPLPEAHAGARGPWRVELSAADGGSGLEDEPKCRDGVLRWRLPAEPAVWRVRLEAPGGIRLETWLLAAPPRAFGAGGERRGWGVFAPLHAVYREGDPFGMGDLRDLGLLQSWIAALGGDSVATLPLLACFVTDAWGPTPYAPVSRRFWNELFLDLEGLEEVRRSPAALGRLDRARRRAREERWSESRWARQEAVLEAKRDVIEAALAELPVESPAAGEDPELLDYARFRAACDDLGVGWRRWSGKAREGNLSDYPAAHPGVRYHAFVQRAFVRQMERATGGGTGVGLFLDLPVGVHPDGYDVWRRREAFVEGMQVGAPPDELFPQGQDWGVPPPHPGKMLEGGCGGFRRDLAAVMRHAGVLRLDHVMGLHRLFWIPKGAGPEAGLYVRYPSEPLYAAVRLVSHQHRCVVVGEDLGTVPPEVRPALRRHGLKRSYVIQAEIRMEPSPHVAPPEAGSIATPGTHDMPPFRAFVLGLDIPLRARLGLLDPDRQEDAARERARVVAALAEALLPGGGNTAGADPGRLLQAVLEFLGASDADGVVVALDDLLGETEPQNVPGTHGEYPNWRRKLVRSLDAVRTDPQVLDLLRLLDRARRNAGGRNPETP